MLWHLHQLFLQSLGDMTYSSWIVIAGCLYWSLVLPGGIWESTEVARIVQLHTKVTYGLVFQLSLASVSVRRFQLAMNTLSGLNTIRK